MNTSFEIEGKRVGEGSPVYVVAELSANHGQRLGTAPRPLDRVTLCGEVLGQHLAHGGLVIDDQDPSKGHYSVFYPRDGL